MRRFDAFALASAARAGAGGSIATSVPADADSSGLRAIPEPGLPVDYCIFCYHGTPRLMRPDNTALLSRFLSEGGAVLPRRFTRACVKHQRQLGATIQRSRWLNLMPYTGKLHPRLRFSSMRPDIAREGAVAGAAASAAKSFAALGGGSAVAAGGGDEARAAAHAAAQRALLRDIAAPAAGRK